VLDGLYVKRDQTAPVSIRDTCRALPVDILIAKDTDAAWKNGESWVWKERPVFANGFVRVFSCDSAAIK